MPGKYIGDSVVAGRHPNHRVGGWDRGINRGVGLQGLHVGGDYGLGHQRPYGVMQQDVAVLIAERGEGGSGCVVPGFGSLQDLADLVVVATAHDGANLVQVAGRHHYEDLVDQRGLLHSGDGVLNDRLAGDFDQLLGNVQADPDARATSQHNAYVPQRHWRSLSKSAVAPRSPVGDNLPRPRRRAGLACVPMTESLLPGWARRIRRQLATRFRIKIIPRPQKDSLRPVPERSLLDLARAEGWQLDPADEKFLWRLERRLKNRTTGEVAVLIDARSESLAAAMAERFPNLTIRAISSSGDRPDRRRAQPIEGLPAHKFSTPASQRHEILTAFGPFHFIVDSVAGSAEPQLTRMREVFFHLKPQGLYIATADRSTSTNGTESVTGFLARMIELRSSGLDRTDSHPDELSFAKALGTVIIE